MAKVRALAQGTKDARPDLLRFRRRRPSRPLRQPGCERSILCSAGQFQGRLSEKRYQAEQAGNSGNVHVTVFSLRP